MKNKFLVFLDIDDINKNDFSNGCHTEGKNVDDKLNIDETIVDQRILFSDIIDKDYLIR